MERLRLMKSAWISEECQILVLSCRQVLFISDDEGRTRVVRVRLCLLKRCGWSGSGPSAQCASYRGLTAGPAARCYFTMQPHSAFLRLRIVISVPPAAAQSDRAETHRGAVQARESEALLLRLPRSMNPLPGRFPGRPSWACALRGRSLAFERRLPREDPRPQIGPALRIRLVGRSVDGALDVLQRGPSAAWPLTQ